MNPPENVPVCDLDFYSSATIANPVAAYEKMLAKGPLVWLKPQNMLTICGYQAVTSALRDHRCFSSGGGVSINEDVNKLLIGSTLNSDPPAHDKTRAITFGPLAPKALQDVRSRIVREAELLADRMVQKGTFDAAADLAPHLPLTIVRDLVGLGDHGKENMLNWGAATFELMGDSKDRRNTAIARMKDLRRFLESPETLSNLSKDGWAERATQLGMAQGMAPEKAVELMRDYIAPSLDTTISAIGYGIWLFAQNPSQWELLRKDRSLIRNAIEEIVRLNTPIRAFSRLTLSDAKIEDVIIPKQSRVLVVFGAANSDPAKFPQPNTFDINRNTRGHVGFGHGIHACLGMHLARLEMDCLFNALADRVAHFELSGPVQPSENATIHAFAKVPVTVT